MNILTEVFTERFRWEPDFYFNNDFYLNNISGGFINERN